MFVMIYYLIPKLLGLEKTLKAVWRALILQAKITPFGSVLKRVQGIFVWSFRPRLFDKIE